MPVSFMPYLDKMSEFCPKRCLSPFPPPHRADDARSRAEFRLRSCRGLHPRGMERIRSRHRRQIRRARGWRILRLERIGRDRRKAYNDHRKLQGRRQVHHLQRPGRQHLGHRRRNRQSRRLRQDQPLLR